MIVINFTSNKNTLPILIMALNREYARSELRVLACLIKGTCMIEGNVGLLDSNRIKKLSSFGFLE